MSSRKKLVISLSVVAAVVVAAVIAVVAVLAATSQTVSSTISVKYTSVQVDAEVSATYGTDGYLTTDGSGTEDKKVLVIDAADTTAGELKSKEGEDIEIPSDTKTLVFTFSFKNTGSATFWATLTVDEEKTSDKVEVTHTATNVEVTSGNTVPVEVTVTVVDAAESFTDQGIAFSWNLTSTNPNA